MHIGQPAPEFSLRDQDKNLIHLKDFRGKNVVLLFFPLAFTSTCTRELCAVRDSLPDYNNLDAVVFGISVDSLYTLNRFREEQHLNFSLLSDFNKTTSRAYDSLYENFAWEMQGVSKRSAFVIDRAGIIRYAEIMENAAEIPDLEAIKSYLKK